MYLNKVSYFKPAYFENDNVKFFLSDAYVIKY